MNYSYSINSNASLNQQKKGMNIEDLTIGDTLCCMFLI